MEGCQTPVTAWLNAEKVAHASPCVTADASTSALSAADPDVQAAMALDSRGSAWLVNEDQRSVLTAERDRRESARV